ncbi:MAG TPA: YciI family protein [Acidisphaera sp.]|nr:YciI family protein [Acidisphaera sp.]
MRFALICIDRPDAAGIRQATRPAHLDYLRARAAGVVQAGPLIGADGNPLGSLFILDAPDRGAAEAFSAGDPYVRAGLFASATLYPYRTVFQDGAELEAQAAPLAG